VRGIGKLIDGSTAYQAIQQRIKEQANRARSEAEGTACLVSDDILIETFHGGILRGYSTQFDGSLTLPSKRRSPSYFKG